MFETSHSLFSESWDSWHSRIAVLSSWVVEPLLAQKLLAVGLRCLLKVVEEIARQELKAAEALYRYHGSRRRWQGRTAVVAALIVLLDMVVGGRMPSFVTPDRVLQVNHGILESRRALLVATPSNCFRQFSRRESRRVPTTQPSLFAWALWTPSQKSRQSSMLFFCGPSLLHLQKGALLAWLKLRGARIARLPQKGSAQDLVYTHCSQTLQHFAKGEDASEAPSVKSPPGNCGPTVARVQTLPETDFLSLW